MRVFIDFEASSLNRDSYPIEVGWVFEDGAAEEHLIRPAPHWTDWDEDAEAVHGISRERLLAEGEAHDAVARRVLEKLSPHEVFATSPPWDGMWLSMLLRGGSLPRHAMRLKDSDEAHLSAALAILAGAPRAEERAREIMAEARTRVLLKVPAHRALQDAQAERAVWLEVKRLARGERAQAP